MGRRRKLFGARAAWLLSASIVISLVVGGALFLAEPLRHALSDENGYVLRVDLPPPSSKRLASKAPPSVASTKNQPVALENQTRTLEDIEIEAGAVPAFALTEPLTSNVGNGSPVAIRKGVRVNNVEAGSAIIHVGTDSKLSLAWHDLRKFLGESRRVEIAEQLGGFNRNGKLISFDELRDQGVQIRFDSSEDRVDLSL